MGSSSPQQMPPPPDSTFSAAESITTHDTLPPSNLIARDNVLFTGLLAAFAPSMADAHRFSVVTKNGTGAWDLDKPIRNLPVGSVQDFLDFFVKETGATVDYIHDEEAVFSLVKNTPDTVGILLPAMQKNELFRTVILDGALPRKTFSMGHACDKRFYLECRKTDK